MTEERQTTALDLLLDLLRYYWRELLSCGPVVWLLALICREASPAEYLDCIAVLVIALLALNPLRLIGRIAAPVTRISLAAAVGVVLCAVRLPWLTACGRACLVVLGLMIAAAAILTAQTCLLNYSIKQSYEVDRVLAHLTHGTDLRAAAAWENYGCRETRAVLHQAVGVECPEPLVCSSYKAAYLLGFLHGGRGLDEAAAKLEKANATIQQLQKEKERLQNRLDWMQAQEEARQEAARREAAEYYRARTPTEEPTEKPEITQEEKELAILEYTETGHSFAEAAAEFGVSRSGAYKAAQRAKERLKESKDE